MYCNYRLDIASTGKAIGKGKANVCALARKKRLCNKILEKPDLAEDIRQAIKDDDLVVAWADFDKLVKKGISPEELLERAKFMWKGMD